MARLNINVSEKLLSQLRIIAAVQDKTVTEIVTEMISAFVKDKKKDALLEATATLSDDIADARKTQGNHNVDADKKVDEKTANRFDDNDKTLAIDGDQNEEHLITETQQLTTADNQQLDEADRLRTILTEIAAQKPKLMFVDDDGNSYVRNRKEVREKLEAAGVKAKPSQPKLDKKKQRAFRLYEAPEAPQRLQKDRHEG